MKQKAGKEKTRSARVLLAFMLPFVCLLLLWAQAGRADSFGNGDGHHGAFAPTANTSVNSYASIVSEVSPGATMLDIDNASAFEAGQLILVWQATGMLSPPNIGDQTVLDGSSLGAGRYELLRIQSIDLSPTPDRITLASPTTNADPYPQFSTQIVSVFEYTTVNIPAGVTVSPGMAWDGLKGGIVVFLVRDGLVVNGAISADARGNRGGVTLSNNGGCGDFSNGGRGEGIYAPHYNDFSRLNSVNGGGAATCVDSGGAGGGLGGAGGIGGRNIDPMWPPFAGVSINFQPSSRLYFGGGGGGGGANNMRGTSGARGGGVVLIRANTVAGIGRISADGGTALDAGNDGAGGGGAGGTILLQANVQVSGIGLHARGGAGGSAPFFQSVHGGGGGGAGGVIEVLSPNNLVSADVLPGSAMCASGATYGSIGRSNLALVRECTSNAQCSNGRACDIARGLCLEAQCTACSVDTQCNDDNGCTLDRCISNRCFRMSAGAGTVCTGGTGICNGSEENPRCNGCSNDTQCQASTPVCNQAVSTCEATGLTGRVVYYTSAANDEVFTDVSVLNQNFTVDGLTFLSLASSLYPPANADATRDRLCLTPGMHTLTARVQETDSGNDWGYVSILQSSLGTTLSGTNNGTLTNRGTPGCSRYMPDAQYWISRGMSPIWADGACGPNQAVIFTLPFTVPDEGLRCSCSSGSTCALDACFGIDCNDNNDCTTDACSGGVCSNLPSAEGASCAGGLCSSDGICIVADGGMPDGGIVDAGFDSSMDASVDVGANEVGPSDIGIGDTNFGDAIIADTAMEASDFRGGQVSGSGCSCSLRKSNRSSEPFAWCLAFGALARLRVRRRRPR